jgi:predicted DNA-binding ribbon-helix-helix protein
VERQANDADAQSAATGADGGQRKLTRPTAALPPAQQGPIKRSMMIAGHATSISLEPIFWDSLREAAESESLPLNALVARIDAERVQAPDPPNLASAIRVWLFARLLTGE